MTSKTIRYSGKAIDVLWDGKLCIHVGECGRASGDLFVGGREPWCQPDVAGIEEVKDVIERCPTGALTCQTKDGTSPETASAENTVHVSNNGPLYIKGNLDIGGAPDDDSGVAFRAALCRCGQSANKPFCDNSHVDAEFTDSGAVGDRGAPLEEVGGKLAVSAVENGPLIAKGNLTIVSGSGRVSWQGTQAALCRCGASANKPFCDGSHKKADFRSG